jgi:hypothetical protein
MVKAFTIGAQPPTPAQLQKARAELWLAEPGPIEHSFFIAAAGNPKLVIAVTIDAAHPTPAPGSPLQLSPRKPTATPAELASAKSQLWTYSQAITGPFPGVGATLPGEGGVFIESELGNDLVIAIAGVQAVPGIPLQLERRMSTATASEIQAAKGQLWDGIST